MLADKKDIESVNFLIKNFNASLSDAACGYARGGHTALANETAVLSIKADPKSRLLILFKIADIYAQNNQTVEAAHTILELTIGDDEHKIVLRELIFRYAQAGLTTKANTLFNSSTETLNSMGEIYVNFKRTATELYKLSTIANTPKEQLTMLKEVMKFYVQTGQTNKARKLLQLITPFLSQQKAILKSVAYRYALTGKAEHIKNMLSIKSRKRRDSEFASTTVMTTYNSNRLFACAQKINQTMATKKLVNAQGLDWIQPKMQICFLLCAVSMQKGRISTIISHALSSYLSLLSNAESLHLAKKISSLTEETDPLGNFNRDNRLLST
jgi:hypothetical protein